MEMPLWFHNLAFWYVQVAFLVLAAALLSRAGKLRQPRVLLAYWRALLAISLALPFLQPWHGPQTSAAKVINTDFVGVPLPPPSIPAATPWHLPSLQTIAATLGILILAGIAFRFAILAIGLLQLSRLRQASSPIPSSSEYGPVLQAMRILVAAPAEFRLSPQVDSPVTFGFLAPLVLLPERFASLAPRLQSAIACHELLHVRRHDWAHHLGEEVLGTVFWFHPAIGWLISRTRLAREQIVDLEVVRLTEARKPYLEALLEFTNSRRALAAIPAPPFLAERQLVERVTLMLKEVRMSRRRLIVSLSLVSCCLALVMALAARAFPLKAAPRPAQLGPQDGSSQQQKSPTPVPGLQRVEVNYHHFGDNAPNTAAVNAAQVRLSKLLDRSKVETVYDPAIVDEMKKVLEDFWAERGVTVEVRGTLSPWPRSTDYVVLQFDVYQQTVLPGRRDGGVSGGIAGGIAGNIVGRDSHGVANGVSKGIVNGVSGGISGGISTRAYQGEPSMDISAIWLDTVKRGSMPLQARGLGTLVRGGGSATFVARVTVPAAMASDVKPGENAVVASKNGPLGKGHVSSVGPPSDNTRTVDIALDAVPQGTTAGLEVSANIDIGKLDDVLFVGRPVHSAPNSEISLFKIVNNGTEAVRVNLKLGRASVSTIEVLEGLKEGEKVILSDMSSVGNADRVRLTDEKHLVNP